MSYWEEEQVVGGVPGMDLLYVEPTANTPTRLSNSIIIFYKHVRLNVFLSTKGIKFRGHLVGVFPDLLAIFAAWAGIGEFLFSPIARP